jgi:hypothetical protein
MLIIVSFIIIIIWGIYFVIHLINTIENNNPISNSFIYSLLSSFVKSLFFDNKIFPLDNLLLYNSLQLRE